MDTQPLKVVLLVGSDSPQVWQCVQVVRGLPGVKIVGILLDTAPPSFARRCKNFVRNIRSEGWSYPFYRALAAAAAATRAAVRYAAVSRSELRRVLTQAFPERCFSLADIAARYAIRFHSVGNLNRPEAVRVLRECGADLGIVLGTRVLKPGTFGVPRMGCLNLHKGSVPGYRGMPPGFWELYDGASSAGVTVHFVDAGLDTGEIVVERSFPIAARETPDSLREKLNLEGARALGEAISLVRDGAAEPRPQAGFNLKPRTRPRRQDVAMLRRRLPHWKPRSEISALGRDLYLLLVYYSGVYSAVRLFRRLSKSRGAIILHHRVNDYSKDPLTVDTESLGAQLLALSKRYRFSSSTDLVQRIASGSAVRPTAVAIHFDDCYRDVVENGAPILKSMGVPACAFVSSGFVDTDRAFPHDLAKYPFTFKNLRSADLRAWLDLGFELGGHTVNHADLGACSEETASYEILQCRAQLATLSGHHVTLFSFPFGQPENINAASRRSVETGGYQALFSAHGGFIDSSTDRYDIPRNPAPYGAPAVYCLLQVEGLTLQQLGAAARRMLRRLRRG